MCYPPQGGVIFKSRCHQNPSNTVYRIKISLVEKKIKFCNLRVTKREKKLVSRKKNIFFDKLIIKNIQNELLHN